MFPKRWKREARHDKARDGRVAGVGAPAELSREAVRVCIICASKRHGRVITPGYADNLIPGACEMLVVAAVALHTFHFLTRSIRVRRLPILLR
jgi:hypothetical protein